MSKLKCTECQGAVEIRRGQPVHLYGACKPIVSRRFVVKDGMVKAASTR